MILINLPLQVLQISPAVTFMPSQNEKARIHITDNELLHLFNKTQDLDDDLKKSVIDFLDAFLLKQGLKKQLA